MFDFDWKAPADLIDFVCHRGHRGRRELASLRRLEDDDFGQRPKRVLEVNSCARVFGLVRGAIGIAPVKPEGIAL